MTLAGLALRSLRNRLLATALAVLSIAVSVALLVGVEQVRTGVRESFTGTIRGVDLIVGPRGGQTELLLSSVFGIGAPTANVAAATLARWSAHPAVKWVIPWSLGDSHRGFRVIGTSEAFYEHWRFRDDRRVTVAEGAPPAALYDVAIGSEVAATLGYRVGTPIVVAHGLREGFARHEATPFTVTGVLAATGTPIDRSLFVTLEGMEAMHADWAEAAPGTPPAIGSAPGPAPATSPPRRREDVAVDEVSAFFLGTKNRIETLRLQREINTDTGEPLTAIVPGVALAELWRTIGYAENGLRLVSLFVVAVGLIGMLAAIYTSLDARRREMTILRAIGAHPWQVAALLVLESGLLGLVGCLLGVGLTYASVAALQPAVERAFGIHLAARPPSATELGYLAAVIGAALAIGLVPAWRAYRNSLADGLTIRI